MRKSNIDDLGAQVEPRIFLDALTVLFDDEAGAAYPTVSWVAAGVISPTDVVILYRMTPSPQILGRRLNIAAYSTLFRPIQSMSELASIFFSNEVKDPSGSGQRLAVDWADGLGVAMEAIGWIATHEASQR